MPKENIVLSYTFDELSPEVQEKVISSWRNDDQYPWDSENVDTLKRFADIFPVEIKNYEYRFNNSHINWKLSEVNPPVAAFTGLRLRTWLLNNYYNTLYQGKRYYASNYTKKRVSKVIIEQADCPLTGYCMDYDILQPIWDFVKNPNTYQTLGDILQDCLNSWLSACQKDYKYWNSSESIKEDILVRELEQARQAF